MLETTKPAKTSPQDRMAATLRRAGIPAKRIEVYGSQIVITCVSTETAQRWHALLSTFASRVRSVQGLDGHSPVWRVGASL